MKIKKKLKKPSWRHRAAASLNDDDSDIIPSEDDAPCHGAPSGQSGSSRAAPRAPSKPFVFDSSDDDDDAPRRASSAAPPVHHRASASPEVKYVGTNHTSSPEVKYVGTNHPTIPMMAGLDRDSSDDEDTSAPSNLKTEEGTAHPSSSVTTVDSPRQPHPTNLQQQQQQLAANLGLSMQEYEDSLLAQEEIEVSQHNDAPTSVNNDDPTAGSMLIIDQSSTQRRTTRPIPSSSESSGRDKKKKPPGSAGTILTTTSRYVSSMASCLPGIMSCGSKKRDKGVNQDELEFSDISDETVNLVAKYGNKPFEELEEWMLDPEHRNILAPHLKNIEQVQQLILIATKNGTSHHLADTMAQIRAHVKVFFIGNFVPDTRLEQGHNVFCDLDENGDYIEPYPRLLCKIWCDVAETLGVDKRVAKLLFPLVVAFDDRMPLAGDFTWHSDPHTRPSYTKLAQETDPLQISVLAEEIDLLENLTHVLFVGAPSHEAIHMKRWSLLKDKLDQSSGIYWNDGADEKLPHPTVVIMQWLNRTQRRRLLNVFKRVLWDLLERKGTFTEFTDDELNDLIPMRPRTSSSKNSIGENIFGETWYGSNDLWNIMLDELDESDRTALLSRSTRKGTSFAVNTAQRAGQEAYTRAWFCSKCLTPSIRGLNRVCELNGCKGRMNHVKDDKGKLVQVYAYGRAKWPCCGHLDPRIGFLNNEIRDKKQLPNCPHCQAPRLKKTWQMRYDQPIDPEDPECDPFTEGVAPGGCFIVIVTTLEGNFKRYFKDMMELGNYLHPKIMALRETAGTNQILIDSFFERYPWAPKRLGTYKIYEASAKKRCSGGMRDNMKAWFIANRGNASFVVGSERFTMMKWFRDEENV